MLHTTCNSGAALSLIIACELSEHFGYDLGHRKKESPKPFSCKIGLQGLPSHSLARTFRCIDGFEPVLRVVCVAASEDPKGDNGKLYRAAMFLNTAAQLTDIEAHRQRIYGEAGEMWYRQAMLTVGVAARGAPSGMASITHTATYPAALQLFKLALPNLLRSDPAETSSKAMKQVRFRARIVVSTCFL